MVTGFQMHKILDVILAVAEELVMEHTTQTTIQKVVEEIVAEEHNAPTVSTMRTRT